MNPLSGQNLGVFDSVSYCLPTECSEEPVNSPLLQFRQGRLSLIRRILSAVGYH